MDHRFLYHGFPTIFELTHTLRILAQIGTQGMKIFESVTFKNDQDAVMRPFKSLDNKRSYVKKN